MSAQAREKLRSQISLDYQYKTMALTYMRPAHAAIASRRSTHVSVPTTAAREATLTVRRVRFSPADVSSSTPPEEEEEEEDDIAEAAHLPQTFQHALPASNLEPGTTIPNFSPNHSFPDPLFVGGDLVQGHSPLQVAARLENSINDKQQLLAELKASIWDKATNQERHPQKEQEEVVPAVAKADMAKTHATAVLLDNIKAVLDVNNCIPQQVIINTGAVCVMMSKRYAVALGVKVATLVRGIEFITAYGALATSLGTL